MASPPLPPGGYTGPRFRFMPSGKNTVPGPRGWGLETSCCLVVVVIVVVVVVVVMVVLLLWCLRWL